MIVYTLGHSTLAPESFLDLVRAHGILGIADVRRFPASRRHPHFAREALGDALAAAGVAYAWLPGLGGRRHGQRDSPHVAWTNAAFRAYADHMETAEFRDTLAWLIETSRSTPTAVMCAESLWWRCHRRMLADALGAAGCDVRHVMEGGRIEAHRLSPSLRIEGGDLVYDVPEGQQELR